LNFFQGLNDATFWYLSQELNFDYHPIQTIDFNPNYIDAWQQHTYMPTDVIEKILATITLK
jgi:hypothetical protein